MDWDLSFLFSFRGIIAGTAGIVIIFQILRNPFWGLLFFLFLLMVQPQNMEIFPGIETFPTVKFFSVITLLSLIINFSNIKRDDNKLLSTQSILLLLLGALLASSGSFSGEAFQSFTERFIPIIIVYFLITLLVTDESKAMKVFYLYTLLTAFISIYGIASYYGVGGLEQRIEYDDDIDRLKYFGTMNGPNDLALVLVSSLPFIITFFITARKISSKIFFAFIFLIHLYAIKLTYSRGGFISMAITFFLLGLLSKRKLLTTGVLIAVIALFVAGSSSVRGRLITLKNANEIETLDKSSTNRLELWQAGLRMIKEHPISGVGMGQFPNNVFQYLSDDYVFYKAQTAHNTFVLLAAEAGLPALCLFLIIILRAWYTLLIIYRDGIDNRAEASEAYHFVKPLMVGIASILASGMFLSQTYSWFLYIFIALTASVKYIYQRGDLNAKKPA